MGVFMKIVTIDFENPRQKRLKDWLAATGIDPKTLPVLTVEVSTNVEIQDFDEDEVCDWYEDRFLSEPGRAERAYRLMAEGDTAGAMEELANEFGLAPPSHERAIADLLSGTRSSIHV